MVEAIEGHLPGKDPHAFVFTTLGGHWWRHSTFYHGRWRPAVEKARRLGLTKNPRIHDLRHTHVAWLLEAGIDLPAIARRLGHKNITTTANTYAHITPTVEQHIADALDHHSNNDTQI